MQLNIKYGPDSITKNYSVAPTIGDIREDGSLRAVLGYGDNINVLIGGVAQDDAVTIPDGSTVVIETAANKKA